MDLIGKFVLANGAVLTPVQHLPAAVRRDIGAYADDDVIVSRVNSRAHSKLVDVRAASLLAIFRMPHTIAQAVARFSREAGFDAELELEKALPMLQSLIRSDYLVPSGSQNISTNEPLLTTSDNVNGWSILDRVRAVEDSEVYRVRLSGEDAALKMCRRDQSEAGRALKHEADMLTRVVSPVMPVLISFGSWYTRPYLITKWVVGADAAMACDTLRHADGHGSTEPFSNLIIAILRAYATLHDSGVVHGDVHPRNLVIASDGSATILDFGAACLIENRETYAARRAGVSFFLEPECAEAIRIGAPLPAPTVHGEQYSLAALIYFLIAGRHYLDFVVEKDEMLRQIAQDPIVPLWRRGVSASKLEPVLRKALSKAPGDRFESVATLANACESASR